MSNFRAQMPGKRSFPRCVRGCEWPPKPWKSEESAETETGTLTLNFKFFRGSSFNSEVLCTGRLCCSLGNPQPESLQIQASSPSSPSPTQ